jgi:arabinogalactan oligomer/maltooligosaccharide transport system substrate-binding protein
MQRIHGALAVTATAMLLLTGCGNGSGTSQDAPATTAAAGSTAAPERADADLVIWTDNLKADPVRAFAEDFGADNGISVAVQVISGEFQTALVTANAAGNGPDVFTGAHDMIGNLVQNGAIDPLQIAPDQLQGYAETAVKAVTYNESV